jgi:hypothetical protein
MLVQEVHQRWSSTELGTKEEIGVTIRKLLVDERDRNALEASPVDALRDRGWQRGAEHRRRMRRLPERKLEERVVWRGHQRMLCTRKITVQGSCTARSFDAALVRGAT